MNRSALILSDPIELHPYELSKKTAFHEAGHAAAIYFNNKAKDLPPIFFQIFIDSLNDELKSPGCHCPPQHLMHASIEGGRLIHTLPDTIDDAVRGFSEADKKAYVCAFETDIVNLLVGPLSEAKYVAQNDNELMTPRLINVNALRYYGGSSDLSTANEYLDCLVLDPEQKEQKLTELFLAAYRFINHRPNWNAISHLADYILEANKTVIDCEEVIAVLEESSKVCPFEMIAAIG